MGAGDAILGEGREDRAERSGVVERLSMPARPANPAD